jgi:Domain of unknown function (DUF4411)
VKFSFDTSAYVGIWKRYYPPENFPTLWQRIEDMAANGKIISSKTVLEELEHQDDDVLDWAKMQNGTFLEDAEEVQEKVSELYSNWPKEYKVDWTKRLLGADMFVIAQAQCNGCPVVTDEKVTKNFEAPRIPDACILLGVECLTPLGFIQKCDWKF